MSRPPPKTHPDTTALPDLQTPLGELLRQAEWGPRQLVAAVNAQLSCQGRERLRLDPTAGYSWVKHGFRPRAPIPDVVAAVLTERLGYSVSVAELWPGGTAASETKGATADLDKISDIDDLARELRALATDATTPRCPVAEVTGTELAFAVVDRFRHVSVARRDRMDRDRVFPGQVELIATHVAALRRLDDCCGGGALSLRYVTAELRSVIDLVECGHYDVATGKALLTVVADLAQLLGWLNFDSGRLGAAERYLLLSLGFCRALGAVDRAANAIGMLSYVSAFAGHGPQAVRLAEAGAAECAKADPVLRARLLGREATAAAADGDLRTFRQRSEQAAETLARYAASDPPEYLYYLNPEQLAAETGQSLVMLAAKASAGQRSLLAEAITLLGAAVPVIASPAQTSGYPRSALLHGAFLAQACVLRGDFDQAVVVMRDGLALLTQVQSPRARNYLFNLRPLLARRSRSPVVRDFLAEFDGASSLV